jgi:glycosyltransferase involved in cell wall biosynthesis
MKVAILTTDSREHYKDYRAAAPYFGTAPEALLEGLAGLPQAEVHVLSCLQEPVAAPEKIAANIWYHALPVGKIGWLRTGYQGCIRAVRRRLAALRPDIVHGQGTERDCALSAVWSGFPNVVTIHGNMGEMARLFGPAPGSYGWLAARLENHALRRTAGVFCNSAYTAALVRPRAARTWQVPNALRGMFFAPAAAADSPRPVLLNVGVVCPNKRQVEILELTEQLHRQGLDFEVRFIGTLPAGDAYARQFLEKLKPLEARGCARYLGSLPAPELVRAFDAAHGLVHFPQAEAFGLVVAEALARGLKVFAARTGGIVDITADTPGTELFAGDDWPGLAAGLTAWLRQGHPRAPGAEALMRARYHPQVIARRHLEIYAEVLRTRS